MFDVFKRSRWLCYGGGTISAIGSVTVGLGIFNNSAGADVIVPVYFTLSGSQGMQWSIFATAGNPGSAFNACRSCWADSAPRAGQSFTTNTIAVPAGVPVILTTANNSVAVQVELPFFVIPPGFSFALSATAANGNQATFSCWFLSCPPDALEREWSDMPG